jgi:hypothetical protein
MAVVGRSVPGQSGRIGVLRVVFTIEFTIVIAIVFASRRGEACAGRWLLRGVERGLDLRRAVAASMQRGRGREILLHGGSWHRKLGWRLWRVRGDARLHRRVGDRLAWKAAGGPFGGQRGTRWSLFFVRSFRLHLWKLHRHFLSRRGCLLLLHNHHHHLLLLLFFHVWHRLALIGFAVFHLRSLIIRLLRLLRGLGHCCGHRRGC